MSVTLMFICGDVINYEHKNGRVCSDELAEIIKSADYAVCNFEAPIGGYGKPTSKPGTHHYQRKETILGLKQQGFDALLLANNHIMDFGIEGLVATLDFAQIVKVDTLGAGLNAKAAYKPIIREINDLKIGMINGCEAQFGVIDHFERSNNAGYAWINHRNIDMSILQLKNECDFVIVFSHAGLEHYHIPQKEWRERYKHFCDLGADVIVGSHPHLPQGYETYNDSLIFYSLGNFYFDSKNYKSKEDQSFAVWLELEKGKNPSFKPIYHYKKDGLVRLAPQDKCINLKSLCSILEENYMKQHDEMCLEVYEKIKRDLILSLMPVPFDGSLVSSLRRIVSKLLGRSKKIDKQLFQLHLLRNEAYYFAVRHALEVKTKERSI